MDEREPSPEAPWVFSLLPKSLQAHPRVEITVIAELTTAGRKLAPVDEAHPAYFVLQSGGFRQAGDAPAGGDHVAEEVIETFLRRSLAARGYLPESRATGRRASLVLVYTWGIHARPARETLTAEELARNLYTRAVLVGGERFARELLDRMAKAGAQAEGALSTEHLMVAGEAVAPVLDAEALSFMSPIERFRSESARNEFLLEQVGNDIYFVIVTAYDYAALARGERLVLWRTRMTASTEGVASADAMPTLLKTASSYLGRETKDVAVLAPRTGSAGKVEFGPLEVKEWDSPLPAPAKN